MHLAFTIYLCCVTGGICYFIGNFFGWKEDRDELESLRIEARELRNYKAKFDALDAWLDKCPEINVSDDE